MSKAPSTRPAQPQDPYLLEDLKAFLFEIFEKEHSNIAKEVSENVTKSLTEYLAPWHQKLDDILLNQQQLFRRIDNIDNEDTGRLKKLELQVKEVRCEVEKRPNFKWVVAWIITAGAVFTGFGIMVHELFLKK